jgi:hypothetical protein
VGATPHVRDDLVKPRVPSPPPRPPTPPPDMFAEFKSDPPRALNVAFNCKDARIELYNLTPNQKILCWYNSVASVHKGMLIRASAGTGETCAGIAIIGNYLMPQPPEQMPLQALKFHESGARVYVPQGQG